jgi:hypothetical protein
MDTNEIDDYPVTGFLGWGADALSDSESIL